MTRTASALLVLTALPALAAGQAAEKAKEPAASVPLKVTVVSVSGPAQKLVATEADGKWQPLQAGQELGELTVIRTGLGAKVVLKFEDRGEVVVNNATKIGLAELGKKGQLATARLGLKYGTLRASVEAARGPNDFQVATPVATLSVRGSSADIGFQVDSTSMLETLAGRWTAAKSLRFGPLETIVAQMFQGGQIGNLSLDLAIRSTQKNRSSRIGEQIGTSLAEQKSQLRIDTGRPAPNLSSGSSETILPPVVPPPPGPPDDEPGYP